LVAIQAKRELELQSFDNQEDLTNSNELANEERDENDLVKHFVFAQHTQEEQW